MLLLAAIALAQILAPYVLATTPELEAFFRELPTSSKPTYIDMAQGQGCVLHVEWQAEMKAVGTPPVDKLLVSMKQANPICDSNAATIDGTFYNRWPLVPSGDIAAGYLQVIYGGIAPDISAVHAQGNLCAMVNVQLDGYQGYYSGDTLANMTTPKVPSTSTSGAIETTPAGVKGSILIGTEYKCLRLDASNLPDGYQIASNRANFPNPYLSSNLKLKGKGLPLDTATYTLPVTKTVTNAGSVPTGRR